jgi:hypothetical protein
MLGSGMWLCRLVAITSPPLLRRERHRAPHRPYVACLCRAQVDLLEHGRDHPSPSQAARARRDVRRSPRRFSGCARSFSNTHARDVAVRPSDSIVTSSSRSLSSGITVPLSAWPRSSESRIPSPLCPPRARRSCTSSSTSCSTGRITALNPREAAITSARPAATSASVEGRQQPAAVAHVVRLVLQHHRARAQQRTEQRVGFAGRGADEVRWGREDLLDVLRVGHEDPRTSGPHPERERLAEAALTTVHERQRAQSPDGRLHEAQQHLAFDRGLPQPQSRYPIPRRLRGHRPEMTGCPALPSRLGLA